MSKTILLLLIAFLPAFSQQKLVLNTAESTINWKGKMWMSTDSHEGIIHFSSGNMTMDKTGKILSAYFEINMNTIKTLDARPDKDGLAEHLKSEDFFAVKRFPKAYFVTTKIEKSTVPNNYNVQGNLTIKGVIKQVSFALKMIPMQTSTKATAELTLYRSWWGINYKAPDFFSTLKNDLIAEEVPIKLNLIFSK
ncbi:YceI family protein [Lacihabitans sp. CS3-21]|uniref:YceI family protein n=1 Tax=Lacihabitans sp. CS3-21 TaxID=2487332 RepID=UPI0020CD8522|nr:YceI family protein [Lacihabitans sp. CS3-21]MCP9745183.1 YceI family protein [Lacihabitans sp. CS3-21]